MEANPTNFRATAHAREPWTQHGNYIRDAAGEIVVRAKYEADARRIVAAINGVRGIPTEALETWMVKDVSDPDYRPDDLDVSFYDEGQRSPHAVSPPAESAPPAQPQPRPPDPLPFDRRIMERRQAERRQSGGQGG
jgi:hypothetical protein